ncbi:MAG: GNAT family N-acetyltransferase, partial [Candidatus Marinimicrobia bacterium]|nr:GNAT family N-acetyltransferase [Candidatus Neomarinimicrobiota bacterium]
TAALQTLIRNLFTNSKIVRVEADCSVDNSPSRRVLEKCGFILVGIKHKYLLIKDTRVDHYNYELLRDEFMNDQSP